MLVLQRHNRTQLGQRELARKLIAAFLKELFPKRRAFGKGGAVLELIDRFDAIKLDPHLVEHVNRPLFEVGSLRRRLGDRNFGLARVEFLELLHQCQVVHQKRLVGGHVAHLGAQHVERAREPAAGMLEQVRALGQAQRRE